MIQAIDHLNIVVADMARSLKFYTEVLGFTKTKEAQLSGEWIEHIVGLKGVRAQAVFVELPGGGPRIELLRSAAPAGVALAENSRANTIGLRHFALRVSDIDAAREHVRARGVEIQETGPIPYCDRFFVFDPDGNRIEVIQWLEPYDPTRSGAEYLDT